MYQDGNYLYPDHYSQMLAGTLTWQDPVHSWKTGPGEVMTVENKQAAMKIEILWQRSDV